MARRGIEKSRPAPQNLKVMLCTEQAVEALLTEGRSKGQRAV